MKRRIPDNAGFTLLELVIAAGMATVLFAALFSFYRSQVYAIRTEEVAVNTKEEADVGLDFLIRELRLAGARPEPFSCGGSLPSGCTSFERIVQARSQRIEVQYDYRGDAAGSLADGCPNDPNERITYGYDAAARTITRTDGAGAAQVLVRNVGPSDFSFAYFDEAGNALVPGSGGLNAANRALISTIEVMVRTGSEHPAPEVVGPIRFARTARLYLRNPAC